MELLNFKPILPDSDPELINEYYKENNIDLPNIPQFNNYMNQSPKGIPTFPLISNNTNSIEPVEEVSESGEKTSTINVLEPADTKFNWEKDYKFDWSKSTKENVNRLLNENNSPGRDKLLKNDIIQSKNKQDILDEISSLEVNDEDKDYLKKLAKRESEFRSNISNQFGYYGLYQFGKLAFEDSGFTKKDFQNDTRNQHKGALKLASINEKRLKPIVDAYVGKEYKGDKVTRNGIRAAAHLLGASTVKDYFNGTTKTKFAKKGFVDGNGTHISEYLKLF